MALTPPRPDQSGASIELRHLTKRFGRFTAVDDVNLSVNAGEFVTLLGPSGSGKTTILNIVAGFADPDEGEVVIDGHSLDGVPPHRRQFGVVFQNYALFPHMTVAANVAFPLRMRGLSRQEAVGRVGRALESTRLTEHASKLPNQLSGGQQQRVALARALVYEPRVVLMDEPLSALDRRLRELLQLELKTLHQAIRATILYVTHDQGEALTLSDRVAVLNQGRLLAVGRPDDLYERPPHPFVASFLGESNRFEGTIVTAGAQLVTVRTSFGWCTEATARDGIAPDDTVLMAIRPERIRVTDTGPGLAGRVQQALFLGETIRLQIELEAGGLVQVRHPNVRGERRWSPGDRVTVVWDPLDTTLLEPIAGAA
jgi:putative spermidine/putrescine transport system ATP-binding protein